MNRCVLRAFALAWVMINCTWLLGAVFIPMAVDGSVVAYEQNTWLAWIEVVMCGLTLPAIIYLAKGER